MYVFDPIDITDGETYTVNWNGTDYSCETIAVDMGGVPAIFFGDVGALDGEPSGSHPFAALVFPAEMGVRASFMPLDGSTTATVSIKGNNVVTKMGEKFLPSNVPPRFIVEVTGPDDITIETAPTLEEVMYHISAGDDVSCRFTIGNEYQVYYNLAFVSANEGTAVFAHSRPIGTTTGYMSAITFSNEGCTVTRVSIT